MVAEIEKILTFSKEITLFPVKEITSQSTGSNNYLVLLPWFWEVMIILLNYFYNSSRNSDQKKLLISVSSRGKDSTLYNEASSSATFTAFPLPTHTADHFKIFINFMLPLLAAVFDIKAIVETTLGEEWASGSCQNPSRRMSRFPLSGVALPNMEED